MLSNHDELTKRVYRKIVYVFVVCRCLLLQAGACRHEAADHHGLPLEHVSWFIMNKDLGTDIAQDFYELFLNLNTPDSLIFVVDVSRSPTGAPKLQVYKAFGPEVLPATIRFTAAPGAGGHQQQPPTDAPSGVSTNMGPGGLL